VFYVKLYVHSLVDKLKRNDTYFRMNKLPSIRMTFIICYLSVCAVSNSVVPRPYFLLAHEVPSKQSLTAWYSTTHTAERRTERAASEQTTKLFVNACGEKCSCRGNFLTESQCCASMGPQLRKN